MLNDDTTIEQFRDEMQHRVVKYPLHSRPVRKAVRFAKRQSDPAFYRIAMDKVHAQRLFRREHFGPTKWEMFVEFFTLGSLREVIVTLLLVAAGVVLLEVTKRAFVVSKPDPYEKMDIDELANRLGIALGDIRVHKPLTSKRAIPFADHKATSRENGTKTSLREKPSPQKFVGPSREDRVEQVAQAVVRQLLENEEFQRLMEELHEADPSPNKSARLDASKQDHSRKQDHPRKQGPSLLAKSQSGQTSASDVTGQ